MRILFLADAIFDDKPGGSRVVARQLAQQLAVRGHDITFLVGRHIPSSPRSEQRPGYGRVVRYEGAGRQAEFLRHGQQASAQLWAEKPFDLVHTHFAYAAQGPLCAIPSSIPRVRTFHGPWDQEGWIVDTQRGGPLHLAKACLRRAYRYQIEARNLKQSSQVITLSRCFERLVADRYHVDSSRVSVVSGGTDVLRFVPPVDKAACRRTLNLPQERPILLSIRRLAPRMGLSNLIGAMPALIARHPDVLLIIGGTGPEKEALERLIQKHHLERHVRLVGFIANDQLATYYQAADLFVLPTVALEGFGLVTTEALSCGLPVVGTNVGATPEILEALDPRLIVPGTSPDALAGTILDYLQNGSKWGLSPGRLHEYVCRNFSWERHASETEAIYEAIIAQGNSARRPGQRQEACTLG